VHISAEAICVVPVLWHGLSERDLALLEICDFLFGSCTGDCSSPSRGGEEMLSRVNNRKVAILIVCEDDFMSWMEIRSHDL
jgi:hypothetical protein